MPRKEEASSTMSLDGSHRGPRLRACDSFASSLSRGAQQACRTQPEEAWATPDRGRFACLVLYDGEVLFGKQNEVASWSASSSTATEPVVGYKYSRVAQNRQKASVFRCTSPHCDAARSGIPIDAVKPDKNGLQLVQTCSCGKEPPAVRNRLKRQYNAAAAATAFAASTARATAAQTPA
jgi:hypothetical protein